MFLKCCLVCVDWCSLFAVVRCLRLFMFVVCTSLLVIRCVFCVVRRLLFVACRLWCVVCPCCLCLLFVGCWLFVVVCCFVRCCSLVVGCWLAVDGCALLVARCL